MKKGIFFSTFTLIFILLLVTFSGLLLKESNFNKQINSDKLIIITEKSLEQEIAYNTLDIINMKLKNTTENSVYFENFTVIKNYDTNMQNYENFLNTAYQDIVNKDINTTLETKILIHPYRTEINIDNVTTISTLNISTISLDLHIPDSFDTFNEPSNDSSGITINIDVYNLSGSLVNQTSITLDPTESAGNQFLWTGNGNQTYVNLQNNILSISSDIETRVSNLKVNYNYDSNIRLYTGNLNLEHKIGKIEI